MPSKNLSLAFIVLLAGQGTYAQQSFELIPAPSELTAPQAAVTLQPKPKPKKNPKKSTFYTGKVKITSCTPKEAVGIDLATGNCRHHSSL